jgi:hypothetical protein
MRPSLARWETLIVRGANEGPGETVRIVRCCSGRCVEGDHSSSVRCSYVHGLRYERLATVAAAFAVGEV